MCVSWDPSKTRSTGRISWRRPFHTPTACVINIRRPALPGLWTEYRCYTARRGRQHKQETQRQAVKQPKPAHPCHPSPASLHHAISQTPHCSTVGRKWMKRDDKESERECQARELALSPGRAAVSSPAVSSFSAPVSSGVVHGCGSLPGAFCPCPTQRVSYRHPWENPSPTWHEKFDAVRRKGPSGGCDRPEVTSREGR